MDGDKQSIKIQKNEQIESELVLDLIKRMGLAPSVQIHHQLNNYNNMQSQKQEHRRHSPSAHDSDQDENEDQPVDENEYEMDGFIVPEDEEDSYSRGGDSDEQGRKRKKKSKKHKKEKKRLKKQKRALQEEDYDEDDLDIIDNQEQAFTRLKKKKQAQPESDYEEDQVARQAEVNYEDDQEALDDQQEDLSGFREVQDEQSLSQIREVIQMPREIFDPADLKKLTIAEKDKELVNYDLPERYIEQIRTYARSLEKPLAEVIGMIQKEDKSDEAQWIYNKMRAAQLIEGYDQRDSRDRIKKILQCRHNEHLQTMYIYYYRKKIYAGDISLESLWKIQEFDEQWFLFREKQSKMAKFLEQFLTSYTEIPQQLLDFIKTCSDVKYLRYFEQFQEFAEARWLQSSENQKNNRSKKYQKLNFVTQMAEKGVAGQLQSTQIFLSPQSLCYNLKMRSQERKPFTPNSQPKDEFQRVMNASDTIGQGIDKSKYPLLVQENRFKTFTRYLSYELFCYPQLRRILREKYYKKLVISTYPTKKGQQQIDIYNMYFPIKRIKDKPISTLKKQIWILAQQAEKLDLIKIDLKFQWQLTGAERDSRERDTVYQQIARNYYDISSKAQMWNLFRKRVVHSMLNEHFIAAFIKQTKEDLTRQGEKEILNACCKRLREQLNKGPSLVGGKPKKILSMMLVDNKLGVAFVDEAGKPQFSFHISVENDEMLKNFVSGESLASYIKEYKPNMILIGANCKRAQTLRKQLRDPNTESQREGLFSQFGEVEVPRLMAKKRITQGISEDITILQAISMARLKTNPMAEIIGLWADRNQENGVLSMNLHPYQDFVNQSKLKASLQKVIIEIVNMVGVNLNELVKNDHLHNVLPFINGLGPKKAFSLLQKLKDEEDEILGRDKIKKMLKGQQVCKNCCPFFKIQTNFHNMLFQKIDKDKKSSLIKQYEDVDLLDMTRIPFEWYNVVKRNLTNSFKTLNLSDIRNKKQFARVSDENVILLELFKNPEKIRSIGWQYKDQRLFDQELVKNQIMNRFRNPRQSQKVMDNKDIFYNLLGETPQTLKRYSILQVKVLSIKKNYLNVIVPENGLFGYIKLPSGKQQDEWEKIYEKGTTIKAVVIGFPFDQRATREPTSQQQQLLKIQMGLDYPHKDQERQEGTKYDFMTSSFPSILKELHPLIDLDKDHFDLRKQDRPVIEVKQEKYLQKNIKADFRRISHPKFRNISAGPAIDTLKNEPIGQFLIRPSSQGIEYLTISWHFFKAIVVHIKIRCEHKGVNSLNVTYRIEDRDNKSFNSLEEIIQKCIKPMNILVQDVTSNKKFMNTSLEQIESQVKRDMAADSSHIYYYFGVSDEYPQFIVLIYMYRDKKPIRELIKVKSSGFYFHDQQFSNIRDLIVWFKEHLKEKQYQKYVKNASLAIQKIK